MSTALEDKIKQVILDLLPGTEENEITSQSDIFAMGLDSVNAMNLIMTLQSTFSIEFAPTDIQFENFRTPETILDIVQSKKTTT